MSGFQGFSIKLNLQENVDDRDVLNNLGGAPIADDIVLFLNNLRNKSELIVTAEQIDGSFIVFDANTTPFVYTNGTQIFVDRDQYFIGDSNAENRFRLYADSELTELIPNPPTGTYVRSEAVTFSDILNLVPFRDVVVEDASLSGIVQETDSATRIGSIYNSIVELYNTLEGSQRDIADYISLIDTGIDLFDQKKQTSITGVSDFDTRDNVILSGSITTNDPDDINVGAVSTTSGPGIFILDPSTNQGTRVFSSSENVWSEVGDTLVAETREAVVGNFVFDEGVRILQKGNTEIVTEESGTVTSFSHFIKILADGEEYYLCLK
jgi:hypothetical protein